MQKRQIMRIFAGLMVLGGILVALLFPWDFVLLDKKYCQLIQNPNGTILRISDADDIPEPLPSDDDSLYNYQKPTAQDAVEWVFPGGIGLYNAARRLVENGQTEAYIFPVDKIYELLLPEGSTVGEKVQWSYLSMLYAAYSFDGTPFDVILHRTDDCATCKKIAETYRNNEENGRSERNIPLKKGQAVVVSQEAKTGTVSVQLTGKECGIYYHCAMRVPGDVVAADYLNQFGLSVRNNDNCILEGYRAANIWRTVAVCVAAIGLILGILTFVTIKRKADTTDGRQPKSKVSKEMLLRLLAGAMMLIGLLTVLLQPWTHIVWEGTASRIVQQPGQTKLEVLDAEYLKEIPDSDLEGIITGKTMDEVMDRLLVDNNLTVWVARSVALNGKTERELIRLDRLYALQLPNDMKMRESRGYSYAYAGVTYRFLSADKKSSEIWVCTGNRCATCKNLEEKYHANQLDGHTDRNLKLHNGKAMLRKQYNGTDEYVTVEIWGEDGGANFHGSLNVRYDQFNNRYLGQFGLESYLNPHYCLQTYRLSEIGRMIGAGLMMAGGAVMVYSCRENIKRRIGKKKRSET